LVTIGSTTTELDAEANLTFDGSTLIVTGDLKTGSDGAGHEVTFFSDTADGYMKYDDAGNLYIRNKNASQGSVLDIYQEGDGKSPFNLYTSNSNSRLRFYNDSNTWSIISYRALSFDTGWSGSSGAADQMLFHTNSQTLAMTINDAQQVIVAKSAMITQTALTSSSSAIAWDAKAKQNTYHVTTENTTFSAPSNAVEGAIISVEIAQGGTARTVAWNTVFEFAASTAPTITATASKTDILTFRYNGSVWQEIGRTQNMAQT